MLCEYLQFCFCTSFSYCSFFIILQIESRSPKSVFTVIAVLVVMLLSIGAGFVFIKKYVCGGRFVFISAHIYCLVKFCIVTEMDFQ